MMDNAMKRWAELGVRFAGSDIKSRRLADGRWLWTAKLITHKNSNAEYRIECTGATCEEAIRAALARVDKIEGRAAHYPPGMGEESRRLHREYNTLVREQLNGARNGADVVRLTDEAAAKGIILVPGGENL